MTLNEEESREEYKPLYIPAHYEQADTQENKIVYKLMRSYRFSLPFFKNIFELLNE